MSLSPQTVEAVWREASFQGARNEMNGFRKDSLGTWIRRQDYGDRESKYGWEVDHIFPNEDGGSDDLSNLQPLHWKRNMLRAATDRLVRSRLRECGF